MLRGANGLRRHFGCGAAAMQAGVGTAPAPPRSPPLRSTLPRNAPPFTLRSTPHRAALPRSTPPRPVLPRHVPSSTSHPDTPCPPPLPFHPLPRSRPARARSSAGRRRGRGGGGGGGCDAVAGLRLLISACREAA